MARGAGGLEGFGEERGEGTAEGADDRGKSSNLRRDICGVGGVELLAGLRGERRETRGVRWERTRSTAA